MSRDGANTFTGSYSTNGIDWFTAGTVTIASFPSTILEGVAVTSHNTSTATTASIGNVRAF